MAQANNSSNDQSSKSSAKSDAKRLADQHLADPNHVITDEDLKKIRVGVSGEADAPTEQAVKEGERRIADVEANREEDTVPGAQKATPWDVINP